MKKHFTLCHSEKRDDPFVPGEYVDVTVADMGTWATSEAAAWEFFNRMLDRQTLKRLGCWVREDKQ